MATRRTERTTTRTTTTGGGRQVRATSRMATETEVEEDDAPPPGAGMAEALGIVSFLLLVGGFILIDMYRGHSFGTGLFFKP